MFSHPANFQEFLSQNNYTDKIYEALAKEDLSEVVITVLDILKTTNQLPPQAHLNVKLEDVSTHFRSVGNAALKEDNYQAALMNYNQALLNAPKNSKAMLLAFSNRSYLFFKVNAYEACLKDIETCFSMECPNDILNKLNKRKQDVRPLIKENEKDIVFNTLAKKYFDCAPNNSEIPCATPDVKAVGSIPKIVAVHDIKVGSVISCERAYVSYTNVMNSLISCHFCQAMALNLIPCKGCNCALFCDDTCMSMCFDEYHKYECNIMNIIRDICMGPIPNLMIKAALKLRANCKSWRELIIASHSMGIERIRTSSIQEIFDYNSKFSVLNQKDDRPFIYGTKYDASFVCASLIHYLDELTNFFPKDIDGKTQAMRGIARVMMFLSLYCVPWKILQATTVFTTNQFEYHEIPNVGLFSFMGKLKNSCTPNIAIVYRNNKISLMALQSIKCGEELTISYQTHRLETNLTGHQHNVIKFLYHGKVCTCNICKGDKQFQTLSKSQKKLYNSLNFKGVDDKFISLEITGIYEKLLQVLDQLKNVPQSQEYKEVFKRYWKCKLLFEVYLNGNKKIGCD